MHMTPPTTLLRNGTLYDGAGGPPVRGDVLIRGDRIAAVGELRGESADRSIDLDGLAVAPGFINMLSWATESLIEDGRSMSDIKQGVTLEVMGEGTSMGPLNDEMKQARDTILSTADITYDIEWDDPGRISGVPRAQGRGDQCGVLRRLVHAAHSRRRLR